MLTYKQQDGAKLILGEKEMNLKVFELNNLLCQLEGPGYKVAISKVCFWPSYHDDASRWLSRGHKYSQII